MLFRSKLLLFSFQFWVASCLIQSVNHIEKCWFMHTWVLLFWCFPWHPARNFDQLPVGAVCVADVQFKGRGINMCSWWLLGFKSYLCIFLFYFLWLGFKVDQRTCGNRQKDASCFHSRYRWRMGELCHLCNMLLVLLWPRQLKMFVDKM